MTDTPYDQLPPDRQAYSRGIFTIGSNSIQLKATGKLKSEFQVNHTKKRATTGKPRFWHTVGVGNEQYTSSRPIVAHCPHCC